jgi:hypothetical protein
MLADGPELFVASGAFFGRTGSVTEVDASTGALVKVSYGARYRLDAPVAMVLRGSDLFVANGGNNSLTEIDASTGALVRVVSGPAYQFDEPSAMVRDGNNLFVANQDGSSVTKLPA